VRRLFSTFARGWPGVGLLVLRLAAGSTFITRNIFTFGNIAARELDFLQLVIAAPALLLIIGLWTPVAAAVMVLFELWRILSRRGDPSLEGLLCALAVAIALLGPGPWSVDARLFGWKRIEIDTQKNKR
jgi:putative oxidoreductase